MMTGRKPEGAPERSPKADVGAPSGIDGNDSCVQMVDIVASGERLRRCMLRSRRNCTRCFHVNAPFALVGPLSGIEGFQNEAARDQRRAASSLSRQRSAGAASP
jgi:hypothetical protein